MFRAIAVIATTLISIQGLKAPEYRDRETKLVQTEDSSCPSVTIFIECSETCIANDDSSIFSTELTSFTDELIEITLQDLYVDPEFCTEEVFVEVTCLENCILTESEVTVIVTIYDEGLVLEFIIPLE
ncbi:hypothetical protein SteCoe_35631 [Stentor coeruleus]|uniref:Uncharacterized protein n=1 Tax=Stentor coeruleus TaxID=5963 RepID=A0A1R2ARZ1_9CILI|nr:hypothetical protein SteCoe_35631 [Stentor coeruleus]